MIVTDADDRQFGHAKDCADVLTAHGIANAHQLVRNWIRRGKLQPVTEFDGRPVYAMADVNRVELATRRRGKRGRNLTNTSLMTHA